MSEETRPETVQYGMYRTTILCWRCWHRYHAYSPYEFADIVVLHCDKCGAARVTDTYGHLGEAEKKFLNLHYPASRGWADPKQEKEFLKLFEEKWTEGCSCGGRFRLGSWPSCPRCHAKPLRWLSVTSRNVVQSPPLKSLKVTIPPEYANAPPRPPRYRDGQWRAQDQERAA